MIAVVFTRENQSYTHFVFDREELLDFVGSADFLLNCEIEEIATDEDRVLSLSKALSRLTRVHQKGWRLFDQDTDKTLYEGSLFDCNVVRHVMWKLERDIRYGIEKINRPLKTKHERIHPKLVLESVG